MSDDLECPYCGEYQEVNHDDGYGYEEDVIHQQQCRNCDKHFTFTTSIIYYYNAAVADCLNDGEHKWKPTHTFPKEFTMMECQSCGERRKPSDEELNIIKNK